MYLLISGTRNTGYTHQPQSLRTSVTTGVANRTLGWRKCSSTSPVKSQGIHQPQHQKPIEAGLNFYTATTVVIRHPNLSWQRDIFLMPKEVFKLQDYPLIGTASSSAASSFLNTLFFETSHVKSGGALWASSHIQLHYSSFHSLSIYAISYVTTFTPLCLFFYFLHMSLADGSHTRLFIT